MSWSGRPVGQVPDMTERRARRPAPGRPGIGERALVDIDSLLRPVFGHAKQGASYGHTKIAGKQVLRKGLSPLAATISTAHGAPVIAGIRLRAGRAGSGKGAATMVTDAVRTARAAGATGEILVRGDSAYGNSVVIGACLDAGARFSFVLTKNATLTAPKTYQIDQPYYRGRKG